MQKIGKRLILAVPDAEIIALDRIAAARIATTREPVSRAALIREAMRAFIIRHDPDNQPSSRGP